MAFISDLKRFHYSSVDFFDGRINLADLLPDAVNY